MGPVILILVVIIFILIVLVALVAAKKKSGGVGAAEKAGLPYVREATLLSPAERSFFGVLEGVVGEKYRILAKVRLADVLKVKSGQTPSERTSAQNKIDRKHVDFLLCRPCDFGIAGAIELDDASHNRPDRVERDEFLAEAFRVAGIPLVRFAAKRAYTIQEVQNALATVEPRPKESEAMTGQETNSPRACPECGGTLVLRTSNRGEHAGKQFWGCSNYPKCKHICEVSIKVT